MRIAVFSETTGNLPFDVVLQRGSYGGEVRTLQSALKRLGWPLTTINGVFDAELEASVMAYQRSRGIVVGAGQVGPLTWQAIDEDFRDADARPEGTVAGIVPMIGWIIGGFAIFGGVTWLIVRNDE